MSRVVRGTLYVRACIFDRFRMPGQFLQRRWSVLTNDMILAHILWSYLVQRALMIRESL